MTCLLLSLLIWAADIEAPFSTAKTLAPISEDLDIFLETPLSFDFDSQDNFYLLDGGAKMIFKWAADGSFSGTIGKAGQGPGEFVLSGRGPMVTGYINIVDDQIFAMDPRKREIMIFATDGTFKRSIPVRFSRGLIHNFAVLGENSFLAHWRTRRDEGFFSEVCRLNGSGEVEKVLYKQADDTFAMSGSGSNRTFRLKAFNPTLVSTYNTVTNQLLVGHSSEPKLEIIAQDGSKTLIKLPAVQEEVTKADKDEYLMRFQNGGGRWNPEVDFPEKKAFYTHMISLGEKGLLVYSMSDFYHNVNGYHLDNTGKVIKRFSMACGEQGSLLQAKGRVLAVVLNEDGDFIISELKI